MVLTSLKVVKKIFKSKLRSHHESYRGVSGAFEERLLRRGRLFYETIIAKDARHSYRYALDVLEGRFELGEPAIAKDPTLSYYYAVDVLEERFELGEAAIASNACTAYYYAVKILKGRFELGEPEINLRPLWKADYERDILGYVLGPPIKNANQ